jgi:DNA invertase Pin-like site-specific DNA recombinase
MIVALYARVSTGSQEAENQLAQMRQYCAHNNWTVSWEYVDVISGKEDSRPNWDLMFKDAHKAYFEKLVFWDLSRFSRSGTLYTLQKLKELENLRIEWHSYNEPYVSTAGQFKDVVIAVIASVAKLEREKISERTKAGLARAKNVGKRGKDKKPRRVRSDRGTTKKQKVKA